MFWDATCGKAPDKMCIRDSYKDANGDWLTEDDFTAALASYQDAAAIPLFIGSDEEGGTVTRASKNPNLFSEPLPSPQELYAAGGLDGLLERTLSYNQKLKAFGVNVNFAPVCDVSTNPDNFIYARSFGQNAQTTADYISSVVPVYAQSGIACVLKHFPGYGNNALSLIHILTQKQLDELHIAVTAHEEE